MTSPQPNTFDPAKAPYPYSTPDGEPYVFPLADYPTEESVRAWLVFSSKDLGDPEWEWDVRRGRYPVHDHDEDYSRCGSPTDPEVPCPKSRMIEAWWVE